MPFGNFSTSKKKLKKITSKKQTGIVKGDSTSEKKGDHPERLFMLEEDIDKWKDLPLPLEKDPRDAIIESIPLADIQSLVQKFGCLKQYTLKHSKLNGVEVVTKIPRWADPNNTEPDNQLRKRILKWVEEMQARTKLTVI